MAEKRRGRTLAPALSGVTPFTTSALVVLASRRRLERPGDDLALVLVHQRLPSRLHARAHPTDADTVVLEVEDEVLAALERALDGALDRVVDADARLLQRAREDVALGDVVFVGIHADAPLIERRGLGESAVAAGAGDLEDHVGALADLVLRGVRAQVRLIEA